MKYPCKVFVYERKPGVWCWQAHREIADGRTEHYASSPKSGYPSEKEAKTAATMTLYASWRIEWGGAL